MSSSTKDGTPTPTGASDASGLPLGQIGRGWRIYDTNQAALLGTVVETKPGFLHLKRGRFRPQEIFVPERLISSVDARYRRVFLSQNQRTLAAMDLSRQS